MNAAAPAAGAAVRERSAATVEVEGPTPTPGAPSRGTLCRRDGTTARTRTLLALTLLTALGAVLRAHGFSSLGFFRDDAWVALSARQSLGTAVHMWVAAPGYFFGVRAFMLAGPDTTWWAQVPAFVAGVACIPAMYALARHFRLSRVAGLVTAGVVSVSPVAVIYATRLKVYETDFLLTCVLLALAETTRRRPGRRQVAALAIVSVLAFVISASVAAVIAGAWIMIAWSTLRRPWRLRHVVIGLVATTAGCGLVALVAYAHVSPTIGLWWPDAYVQHSSPAALVSSLGSVTWSFLVGLFGFASLSTGAHTLVVLLGLALVVTGVYRNAAMLAPAVTVAIAYVASAAHRVPLGTGRTDMYLYPVVLLLLAAGATNAVGRARAMAAEHLSDSRLFPAVAVSLAAILFAGILLGRAVSQPPTYPGVDVHAIAQSIAHQERPGDRIFVSELARFGWAEEVRSLPITLRFGSQWAPGFTVVSQDPRVFLATSEYLEGASHPVAWAAAEDRAHAHRIWYVWSPPLAVYNPSFAALRADGWRAVRTVHATGINATLLVRP